MLRFVLAVPIGVLLYSFANAYETVSAFETSAAPLKVLIFLSKDCPCSRSHVEHLNELSETHKSVNFFAVITDVIDGDNHKDIESYFHKNIIRFPIIQDTEQKLIKAYGALKTPHVALFQRQANGQYTRIYEGGVTNHRDFASAKVQFLKQNLQAATEHKRLPFNNGKSLGCYIRRL